MLNSHPGTLYAPTQFRSFYNNFLSIGGYMRALDFFSCVILVFAMGQNSRADSEQDDLFINLANVEKQGHQEIDLRALLKEQHPEIDLDTLLLDKVEVIAKAKESGSTITLLIGDSRSETEDVPVGHYLDESETSYSRIAINNIFDSYSNPWIIEFHGYIKVIGVGIKVTNLKQLAAAFDERDYRDRNGDRGRDRRRFPFPRPFPRPYPQPNPGPRGYESTIICESNNYLPATCFIERGVRSVYVRHQRSFAPCREGVDWWLDNFTSTLNVRNGCRAEFGIIFWR